MPTPLDCPWIECWPALLGDTLPPNRREPYERHLESCPVCQHRLDRPEECQDELLGLARQVGDPTVAPADPTLIHVLERLHEVKGPDRPAAVEPADLYFLRPAGRPDCLGVLGEYEIQEVIGQGGMGVVLKAFDPALHRLAAIKVLAAAVAGSAVARRRFAREAQAAAAVCHDHVVTVYGVHEADGLPYLVMQYIAGESLQNRLDRGGPLETAEVVRIGLQTASGLAAAHAQGLIHRDVKPANLLLEAPSPLPPDPPPRSGEGGERPLAPPLLAGEGAGGRGEGGRVKITDFGLARMIDDVQLTQNGVVAGTPEYMAPEQARGETVDHRADLFSLGSVMYALCTGAPPFRASTALAVLRQVTEQVPAPIHEQNRDVPAWLEAFIARLMAKDPANRFQSAAEVVGLLEGFLAHLRQPATVPVPEFPTSFASVPAKTRRPLHRLVWLSAFLVAFVLPAAMVLGIASWLGAGGDATPNKAASSPDDLYQDFRNHNPLESWLRFTGQDHDNHISHEPGGCRITLPAGRKARPPLLGVGAKATMGVPGNFEITVSYELLSAAAPTKPGNVVGMELFIMRGPDGKRMGRLGRFNTLEGGAVYEVLDSDYQAPRKTGPLQLRRAPTREKRGQLRLVREGELLSYQVKDETTQGAFKELFRAEFGTETLTVVLFAVNPGQDAHAVDARLIDFRIRGGGRMPDPPATEPPPEASQENPPRAGSTKGLVIELLGLLIVASLAVALGVWLYRRQGRRAPPPAGEAPAVSFACPACGKNLKARAELAGKKVKCSQCGKAVAVPVAGA